jgi:hypothetical protein
MNRLSHSDSDNDKESKNKKSIIEKSTAKSKEKNVEQGSKKLLFLYLNLFKLTVLLMTKINLFKN